ncbi:MAG: hypothetical protein GYA23_00870, partial [Methanomicrobiales archaeon]|nr:hypothetical protein [Methanomicrobiales archaeon]
SSNMIHSDQVHDLIGTPEGGVLIATSSGLSRYSEGRWSTRHVTYTNISEGLMDDYITAIEYDHDHNLWIGYSGGIQIDNGVYYRVLRDTQLFKDTRIHDLQRWNNDMWVATGHSGIHRYRDGTWTWFQPMSKGGPGFYEITTMALDTASNSLIIATADNGSWMVSSPDDPVPFTLIAEKGGPYGSLQQVRRDPFGGVYFFDDNRVMHYTPETGFVPVLTVPDLTMAEMEINDLTVSQDGRLFLATDDGIYIWSNGAVYRHLNRASGIGTTEVIDTIIADPKNRIWFATEGYVGYYTERTGSDTPLFLDNATTIPPTPSQPPTPKNTPSPFPQTTAANGDTNTPGGISAILDPLLKAISALLEKFGIGAGGNPA